MKLAKCGPDADLMNRYGWIITEVAKRHRFTPEMLLGNGRDPRLCDARRDMYLCLWASGLTYSEIGRMLGKDHTSIMYGVKKALAS